MSEILGKTIGQYQLVEIIDEAGDALVYKGFQPSMNRYAAVKVLKPRLARDPAAVQAFLQQGELVAQMQHSNILPIYDSGQEEGVVYRASRFVESGTLRDNLPRFHDPRAALSLVNGLANALDYIHAQGYVHGNLKPTNIFLDEEGRPLLTDFGMPHSGGTVTPYMSPEQVQGGVVDRRTDVYALGVLLYEMLVGMAPPPGVVVSPRAQRPDLPEGVEKVIFKAMAQNPDARFQSASEFRNTLDAALRPVVPAAQPAQAQHAAAPASTQQPLPPPADKKGANWGVILTGGILLVLLCICMVMIVPRVMDYLAGETPEATQPAPATEVVPTSEPRPTREPRPTAPPPPTEPPPEPPTDEPPQPEQPLPTEEPPPEQPPGAEIPEQLPEEGASEGSSPLDQVCGGTAALPMGALALVGVGAHRSRRRLK